MTTKTSLSLTLGSAFLASATLSLSAHAAGAAFGAQAMSQGYQVAAADTKAADGSCGASHPAKGKRADGKCGEGKCGAKGKKADGSCGADKKAHGSCGATKAGKKADGSCGAAKGKMADGSCGASKPAMAASK